MKQFYLSLLLLVLTGASGFAQAPQPYYLLSGSIYNPPPINAVTVENVGQFQVENLLDVVFDFQNLQNFINRGVVAASPGIEFNNFDPDIDARRPLASFINEQSIIAYDFSLLTGSRLLINATNVQNNNNALLSAGRAGLVRIQGTSVNLEGGLISAGDGTTTFGNLSDGTFFEIRNNAGDFFYQNPSNIRDEYWAATNGNLVDLSQLAGGGVSTVHNVTFRQGLRSSQFLDVNPNSFNFGFPSNFFSTNGYLFFASTNNMAPAGTGIRRNTSFLVFVRTNESSPNISAGFQFRTNSANFRVQDIYVEFSYIDIDPLTGVPFTRYLTLKDEAMFRGRVDGTVQGPFEVANNLERQSYFRPFNYYLARSDSSLLSFPVAPVAYTNIIFPGAFDDNERFLTNRVGHYYSAWGFSVSPRDFGGDLGLVPQLSDPTNSPGRVEISGADVNLDFARISAQNMITVTATNGLRLESALLSAPYINVNIPGTNNLVISNNFPTAVTRLNGEVAVWSGVWRVDQRVTNAPFAPGFTGEIEHAYHVLVIDHNLSTNVLFELRDFATQSGEVVIADDLVFGGSLLIGGNCLHIPVNGSVTLSSANADFNVSDAPNLKCLINEGVLSVPVIINLGADRPTPYTNVFNSGLILSGSILVRSDNFTNSGGSMLASSSTMQITATTNYINSGFLQAGGNITLAGDHFSVTGAVLAAGLQLNLTFTNFLGDNGVTNDFYVGNGFRLLTRPNKGDLMATRIISTWLTPGVVTHSWAGENRGATPSGFANNTAIQHLVMNGGVGSRFRFQGTGPGSSNAMYVNYLEFQGATVDTNGVHVPSSLIVDPNITIYFADSNVPEDKLTNSFPGRLVWVDPAITVGPMVAVPLLAGQYAQLTTREYQTMLAAGHDFDGDGVTNERDESPMSGFTITEVTVVNFPHVMALIKWQAVANVTYTIEYRDGLGAGGWQSLYSVTATESKSITVTDLPPAGGQRFYRVRFTVNQ